MLRARTANRQPDPPDVGWPAHTAAPGREHRRTLIIGIDAVPYELVRDLTGGQRGLFDNCHGPAAVISTFPSISDTAWSNLLGPLGSTKPRGYERRYFDDNGKKLRGGWGLTEVSASWKETFDWKMHGLLHAAFAYGFPRRCGVHELKQGLRAFAQSSSDIFAMYVVSTDGLAHLRGPDALDEMLRVTDAELKAFKRRHPELSFNTILLSDHGIDGGDPLINCWPAARRVAKRAGFRVRGRLASDRDVVFNPYGLLTDFVVYSARERRMALADTLSQVPGVDLAATRVGGDAWRVFDRHGNATVERRRKGIGWAWRYHPRGSDPLGYSQVVAELRHRASDPRAEWFPGSWWFEATTDSFYPDALYRLARSFELTRASPSVVCSCAPGYMFGGLVAERVARATVGRLRWSHGALHRHASLGFMMSDMPGWDAPKMIRAEDALGWLIADEVGSNAEG